MKYKVTKIPPLSGTADQKLEQLRNHLNKTLDEVSRAMEELEREIERGRKERR